MTLYLNIPSSPIGGKKSPWEEKGIDDNDVELSHACGLFEEDNDEFEKMMEEQEEFIQDGLDILDELELCIDQRPRQIEYKLPNKIYRNIFVRVISFVNQIGYGTIDGMPCVYIPSKFYKDVSLYELYRMNLTYDETHAFPWVVSKIHPKIEPFVCAEVQSDSNIYKKILVPKQDVGYMIGKGGCHFKNILEDAVQKHPELEEAWSNGIDTMKYSPKLNVHDDNGENYTEMDLWIPISPVKVETKWNPLTDFVKKTYA